MQQSLQVCNWLGLAPFADIYVLDYAISSIGILHELKVEDRGRVLGVRGFDESHGGVVVEAL